METGLLVQYILIALAVIASAWVVAVKQFPGSVRRLRILLATPLLREGRPAWLQGIGRWIAPPGMVAGGKACGGCDRCG